MFLNVLKIQNSPVDTDTPASKILRGRLNISLKKLRQYLKKIKKTKPEC